jgi:rubrerythrin
MDKIAALAQELDSIASSIEKEDPRIALALDMISDRIEKKAYFNQATWLPGRHSRDYPFMQSAKMPEKNAETLYACPKCGNKRYGYTKGTCPRCGTQMHRA